MEAQSKKQTYFLYWISSIAALSGLLFGYDTGVISGAILFIRKDFGLTDSMTEFVVSAVLLGAFLGSFFGGRLADEFGRRRVLIFAGVAFVIGSAISAVCEGAFGLIASRFILGVSIGVSSFTAPLYLAEIAPAAVRGKLVSLNQLAITIGIFASYLVDYALADQESWRWMLGIGVFPALLLLVGLLFLPESPRWNVMMNRVAKARDTLQRTRPASEVETEMAEIRAGLGQTRPHWSKLFTGRVRPILWIAVGLSLCQQATGINTIIYYAPTILQMAGFQQAKGAILATLGLGLVNVIATIAALPLIDRWGRRPLLLFGLVGMGLSLFAAGLSFNSDHESWVRYLAVASMVVYIISFAMSLGPICWLIIAEIFPLEIRGAGAALATSANWAFNMGVAMTFLTLIGKLGPSVTFWLYALACIFAGIFVYRFVPETKGRTLEEIERSLMPEEVREPIFDSRQYAADLLKL